MELGFELDWHDESDLPIALARSFARLRTISIAHVSRLGTRTVLSLYSSSLCPCSKCKTASHTALVVSLVSMMNLCPHRISEACPREPACFLDPGLCTPPCTLRRQWWLSMHCQFLQKVAQTSLLASTDAGSPIRNMQVHERSLLLVHDIVAQ